MNKPRSLTDQDLEKLIRALGEIEQMECARSAGESGSSAGPLLRPQFQRAAPNRHSWTRIAVASLAAAACLLLQLRPQIPANPIGARLAETLPLLRTSYIPEVDPHTHAAQPRDCVQSTPAESCSIVAVLRTFSSECQCLVWDLYQWDTGTVVARAKPGEPIEVVTARPQAPPSLSQVVVFAIARERDLLPSSGTETNHFLDCLMAESPASDANAGVEQYASTVKACLPDNVTVVSQFLARR